MNCQNDTRKQLNVQTYAFSDLKTSFEILIIACVL